MVNVISRLFGNENAESRIPDRNDGWEQYSIAANAQAPAPPSETVATAPTTQDVNVVDIRTPRDPLMRQSVSINLANAGPQVIACRGNTVLYADSTNATDRVQLQYQDSQGDTTQPLRSMIPGRLRRERYFNYISVSWTVTAGAVATIEIYDDPDGALYIQD